MSRCLNEHEVQALADGEGTTGQRAHVDGCASCRDSVTRRRRVLNRIVGASASIDMNDAARAAIRARIANAPATGATTLRHVTRRPRWTWTVPFAAAAAVLVYFVVLPGIDRRTTVSAAEILGRSQAALSAPLTGLEFLAYDLELGGALSDLLPSEQSGRFEVHEFVDHDHAGRYKIVKLAPDGRIVAGAADDTERGTRTRYMRVNGRGFLLRFNGAAPTALSIVALKKSALQLFISLMQTSSAQSMREIDRAGEHCYEISVPGLSVPSTSLLRLDRARAVITAADSRLVEFSAGGMMSGQPFTIGFALRLRQYDNGMGNVDFDLSPEAGDVVLEGDATANPLWDVLARLFEAVPTSPVSPTSRR